MQLLCLGDVALAAESLTPTGWMPPAGFIPALDRRIMINWEFPIGETLNAHPRVSGVRHMAPPGSASMIQGWGPGIATLANNHILDAGEKGLASTLSELHQINFETLGAGLIASEIARPLFWETTEGRLAIVNWVFAETHPDWMAIPGPNCWPGVTEAGETIRQLKNTSDWVLVVVHWSDELFPYPTPEDREIARQLADIGADIVVGHHPHVVRGMEVTHTCPVFYSIGNFYFSEKRNSHGDWISQQAPRNREAHGVRLSFRHGNKPEYEVLSFWNNKREAVPDLALRATRRMKRVSKPLRRFQDANYENWYNKERARFNKWDSLWHFGLRRRGVIGTMRRMVMKLHILSVLYQ